jgi:hypothetical protein
MAEDISLEEKLQRFDAALNKLQRTIEGGGSGVNDMMGEFLEAAEEYRKDPEYRAPWGCAGADLTARGSTLRVSR